jgi:hypothetical protein
MGGSLESRNSPIANGRARPAPELVDRFLWLSGRGIDYYSKHVAPPSDPDNSHALPSCPVLLECGASYLLSGRDI